MSVNFITLRLASILTIVMLLLIYGNLQQVDSSLPSWAQTDNTPPSCSMPRVDPGPPVTLNITAQDTGSGIAAINVLSAENCTVEFCLECACSCTTDPITITATKIDSTKRAFVKLEIIDCAGNRTVCDPIITTLAIPESDEPGARLKEVVETFTDVPRQESFVTVQNGAPGLKKLLINVNGQEYDLLKLRREEQITVDVSFLMVEEENAITFKGSGKPGANALVIISDNSAGSHLHSVAASPMALAQPTPKVKMEFLRSDGTVIKPPLRVGKSAIFVNEVPKHDRTQSLKVKVTPAWEVTNVALSIPALRINSDTGRITFTEKNRDITNGIIDFDLAGTQTSVEKGDVSIIAKHSSGCQTNLPISVVIPDMISKLRQLGGPAIVTNLALNSGTAPPAAIQSGRYIMGTFYGKKLPIEVVDQFNEPIGDIYLNAVIEEEIPTLDDNGNFVLRTVNINVKLDRFSRYEDHAGIFQKRQAFLIANDDATANAWKNSNTRVPPPPAGTESNLDVFAIYVDDFKLTNTISGRKIKFLDNQGNFQIIWP